MHEGGFGSILASMTSTPPGPMADPDDELPAAATGWQPTPTVPFPRPAPPDEPAVLQGTHVPLAPEAGRPARSESPGRPARSDSPGRPLYAGWSRRAAAYVIDLVAMSGPLLVALAYDDVYVGGMGVLWLLAWFVGNRVLVQGRYGVTFGKHLAGVRIVRTSTGLPLGAWGALRRELAHVLDAIGLVGFLRPLWDAHRRTFADSICETTVVRAGS